MAQILKEDIRRRMLEAAEVEFSMHGYAGAKMASIAARAGVSAGNLYRYFKNRDALFYTLITDELAEEMLQILGQRVHSLTQSADLTALDEVAQADGERLLRFWIHHRLRVVILLSGAAQSRYAGFAARFVEKLMLPSLQSFAPSDGNAALSPVVEATLLRIFQGTVHTLVSILKTHAEEDEIRVAFSAFWSYQLAGLDGLRQWSRQ